MRRLAFALLLACLAGCGTTQEFAQAPSRTGTGQVSSPPSRATLPALDGSYYVVQRGETMWRIARSYGLDVRQLAAANRLSDTSRLGIGQRLFIPLPAETRQFLWPVRGSLLRTGFRGLEIRAPAGSLVRASRSGRVAVAARELSGLGKTIIVDHLDGHLTVYGGLDQLLVSPGAHIRQGLPVGSLGSRALHFEIRYGSAPKNTLALLPTE